MNSVSKTDLSLALANLYQEHHHWLYQWLRRKLGSSDRAEDILQDTFIKIMKSKDILNLKEPKAFLHTTAKHLIIDQARRQKIEQSYLHYISQFDHDQAYASPEEAIIAIETLDQIAQALSHLEDRPRQILLMHYLDGISQVEIATQMQLSIKTIQRDLMKALIYCHHIGQA
ncbi:sigma-70 family RNA polymerase sigma factor [Acinetobacter puyangensis]|uniref:sigma-70 family RNA polymerase sigma factor n=1 Tax=Acinetobacter puyangensis TaxID=1096779 RepID=UPI003A4D59F7